MKDPMKKIHNQNKNDEESHTENKNESNMTNDSLLDYFKLNNLTYEEKEKYFILNSNYIKIKYEEIIKLLNDITLAGTKGVKTVTPKMLGEEEFYVEVVGKDLDPLFKNPYIDLDRSRYIVYGNSKEVDYNTRKQNILTQLKRITNIDQSFYNNQHIELLNNFMCRNNTVVPMSRFGMKTMITHLYQNCPLKILIALCKIFYMVLKIIYLPCQLKLLQEYTMMKFK